MKSRTEDAEGGETYFTGCAGLAALTIGKTSEGMKRTKGSIERSRLRRFDPGTMLTFACKDANVATVACWRVSAYDGDDLWT